MSMFKVLIVDDDVEWAETFQSNLLAVPLARITGRDYEGIEFTHVTNQADADNAVTDQRSNNGGPDSSLEEYDLVLLDLRYPLTLGGEPEEDEEADFQGMTWLPELRRLQPGATIVILTGFAQFRDLENVVSAIRDHNANDFIPKTAPFHDVVARIRLAWENARRMQQLLMLEEEFRALLRTRAARTYAEDVAALLGQAKTSLYRIAKRIESGDTSAIASAANAIRGEFSVLNKEFIDLTTLLNEGQERRHEIDLPTLVRQMLLLYQRMIDSVHAEAISPNGKQSIKVTTYEGDLKVALHEVISNALCSLEQSKTPAQERALSITVAADEGYAVIRVVDNGDGFSDEALTRVFERGYSSKGDHHLGLGLYIAKRMMHQIGGEISVRNRDEGGAEVELVVKNLGEL